MLMLLYTEENWRGKRAWEIHKRELITKGEKLDWNDFRLAPVRAEQDFLKVSLMDSWFNRATKNPDDAKRLIRSPDWLGKLAGFPPELSELKDWDHAKTADQAPAGGARAATPAEELLKWFAGYETEFKELDTACERSHARLEGGFDQPFSTNVVNYVNLRTVVQALSARARANLVLRHADDAMHDLVVIRRLMDVLQSAQPTLVSAMIRVAIVGLYVDIVTEGSREGVWQEPQWMSIQEQVRSLHLWADVAESIRGGERAAVIHMLKKYPRKRLAERVVESFRLNSTPTRPTWMTAGGVYILFAPRGWFHQNLLLGSRHCYQPYLDAMGAGQDRIDARGLDQVINGSGDVLSQWSPYNMLAGVFTQNFIKGFQIASFIKGYQTVSKNQTLVNEAHVACGLERYRGANGAYPETLEALVPQFASKLPHDLFDGKPRRYRRTDDGRYLLYSIGWNSKDDGGKMEPPKEGHPKAPWSDDKGDWVWPGVPKR